MLLRNLILTSPDFLAGGDTSEIKQRCYLIKSVFSHYQISLNRGAPIKNVLIS